MKTPVYAAAIAAAFLTLPFAATAGGGFTSGMVNADQDAWSQTALYESCMNGDVSASGRFSSQLAEYKAMVRMGIANDEES